MTSIHVDEDVGEHDVEYQLGTEQILREPEQKDRLLLPAESKVTPAISLVMPTLNDEGESGSTSSGPRTRSANSACRPRLSSRTARPIEPRRPPTRKGAIVVEPDGKGYGYAYQ